MEHKVDYIIVGGGFGAFFFAHQLIKNNKSFKIYSDDKRGASRISAGIINPVVLKRFTSFENALEHIEVLENIFSEISAYLGETFIVDEPTWRIFHDENEKSTWLKKASTEKLAPFLDTNFNSIENIINPLECGKVNHSFRVDVPRFFEVFEKYLTQNNNLIREGFAYDQLDVQNSKYQNIKFSKIVFSEGMGVKLNPYFKEIPVLSNKGHHISVKFENYNLLHTIKKKFFLFPLNKEEYYYGGTYDPLNDTPDIDNYSKDKLIEGLEEMVVEPFEITETPYAYRPTVQDRRPILGVHSKHTNLYVFNGLGTRGLLNGTNYSVLLYNFIENNLSLPKEVDIERFI